MACEAMRASVSEFRFTFKGVRQEQFFEVRSRSTHYKRNLHSLQP